MRKGLKARGKEKRRKGGRGGGGGGTPRERQRPQAAVRRRWVRGKEPRLRRRRWREAVIAAGDSTGLVSVVQLLGFPLAPLLSAFRSEKRYVAEGICLADIFDETEVS